MNFNLKNKTNSWKNVSTSSCVNKAGLSFVGFVKLQTIAHTGNCLLLSAVSQPPLMLNIRINIKKKEDKLICLQLLEKQQHVHIFLLSDVNPCRNILLLIENLYPSLDTYNHKIIIIVSSFFYSKPTSLTSS